jgi:DNA primase catalytic core
LTPSRKLDFEAIKSSTDLVRVVESYGIVLKKEGRDYVGLCPFHEDHNPSLRITPDKGLFRCPACGAAGNVIQFVARKEGIGEKQAAMKLLDLVPGVGRASDLQNPVHSFGSAQDRPVNPVKSSELPHRVVNFYSKNLFKDRAGLDYLKTRNLVDPAMLEAFQVGFCNGSLKQTLPSEGELIEELKLLGILNEKGNEIFYGRVVVPIFDHHGNVCGLYGRRVAEGEPKHLYLAGPHRGVFNASCAKSAQSLFVTESIFDGLSLWQAGFRNVIALYGTNGWTAHHQNLLEENPISELILALDNDSQGRKAAEALRQKLSGLVGSIHSIAWPEGVKDANEFFASTSLSTGLSRGAEDFKKLLPKEDGHQEAQKAQDSEEIRMTANGFTASYGPRRYEVFSIEKPSSSRLRATIKALSSEPGRFHIDTVDFYLARSRRGFIAEAARLFKDLPDTIESDLNRIIVQLENYIQQRLEEKNPRINLVAESERAEALGFGKNPDLINELRRDFDRLGLIGERTNRLLLYLALTSRKMEEPLAVQILASSGAGKSHLQDVVLSLCPEEDLIKLTSLTDQALFYKGENSLQHKALAIAEVAGADGARYALRNLISEKRLSIESTIKNPLTGRLETQLNIVHGPTAVFETTTSPDTDPETKSRYILLSIDESHEQTRLILEAQRQAHTLEGRKKHKQREAILARHHGFQRCLKPLAVINPFEPLLSYGDDRLIFRRDHSKYLNLILAVSFLHQMQRPLCHDPEIGDYIETTLEDIRIANELAMALFGQSLDDLSAPGRELLRLIVDYIQEQAAKQNTTTDKITFSRRELREALGWSEYRLRTHLRELVEFEYLVPTSGRFGQRYSYRLLYAGETQCFVPGLKSVEELQTSLGKTQPRWEKKDLVATSLASCNEVLDASKAHKYRANRQADPNLVGSEKEHIGNFAAAGKNGAAA